MTERKITLSPMVSGSDHAINSDQTVVLSEALLLSRMDEDPYEPDPINLATCEIEFQCEKLAELGRKSDF